MHLNLVHQMLTGHQWFQLLKAEIEIIILYSAAAIK